MINQLKYKNAILYLIQKMDGKVLEGKKKICKLLYFVDFGAFEKYGQPVTGEKYIRMPMGPMPSNFDKIIKVLEGSVLRIKKELKDSTHEYPTTIYELKKEADADVFSKEEKEILDWVIEKYAKLTGKELENISHSEAPWLAVKRNGEEIPYELSYYRGTSF